MNDFFRGRRRKSGCVTLVVACAVLLVWIRSLIVEDNIVIEGSPSTHSLVSSGGTCKWTRISPVERNHRIQWVTTDIKPDRKDVWKGRQTHWRWKWCGFDFGVVTFSTTLWKYNITSTELHKVWQIPYWSVVLPLALLSTYLIIGKRRKPKPQSTPDST